MKPETGEPTTVIVETERLFLRPWTLGDVAAVAPIYADPRVMEFWPAPETPDGVEKKIRRWMDSYELHAMGLWPLVRKSDGRIIGHCGYKFLADGPDIEVGWLLAFDCWGKGYAIEASRAAMKHAFEHKPIERLAAVVRPVNVRSVRVAERLGMRYARNIFVYNFDHARYEIDRARAMKVIDFAAS